MLLIDKLFYKFLKKKDRENLGAESERSAIGINPPFPFFFGKKLSLFFFDIHVIVFITEQNINSAQ